MTLAEAFVRLLLLPAPRTRRGHRLKTSPRHLPRRLPLSSLQACLPMLFRPACPTASPPCRPRVHTDPPLLARAALLLCLLAAPLQVRLLVEPSVGRLPCRRLISAHPLASPKAACPPLVLALFTAYQVSTRVRDWFASKVCHMVKSHCRSAIAYLPPRMRIVFIIRFSL
jgi:hypothetical protein